MSVLQAPKEEDKEEEIVAVEFDDEDQELQENQTDYDEDDDAEQMDQEGGVEFDQVDNMDDDSDVINNDNMYDLDGDDGESDKGDEQKDDVKKDPNYSPFKTRSSARKVRKRPDFYQAG